MARVSLDDTGASSKPAPGGRASSGSGSAKRSASGEALDPRQKAKAGIAIGVIVLAGLYIAYNQGLFKSRPRPVAAQTATTDPGQDASTPENPSTTIGNTRVNPTVPVGAN